MNDTGRRIAVCPLCGKLTILFFKRVQAGGSTWSCSYCERLVPGARFLPAAEEARIVAQEVARGLRIPQAVG